MLPPESPKRETVAWCVERSDSGRGFGIVMPPCSLGLPEQYDHPEFLDACERIFRKARAANVGAGIHFWGDVTQQTRFLEMGANLLIHSADITLFQKNLSVDLESIRQAVGLERRIPSDKDGPAI
jgi:hypothetical protein